MKPVSLPAAPLDRNATVSPLKHRDRKSESMKSHLCMLRLGGASKKSITSKIISIISNNPNNNSHNDNHDNINRNNHSTSN